MQAVPRYAYGYLWWRIVDGPFADLGMFSARGYGGHAIDVLPAAGLVFVHRVDTFWDGSLPFGRERRRVKDSERFRLLDLVLRARIGPPRPEPELVPFAASAPPVEVVRLEADALSKYAGEYDFGEFALRVRVVGESLRIGRPGRGEFGLLPRSAHEFTFEDLDAPVVFQRDAEAGALCMIAEFAPGKRVTAERRARGD